MIKRDELNSKSVKLINNSFYGLFLLDFDASILIEDQYEYCDIFELSTYLH